jgi:hypothetical protein
MRRALCSSTMLAFLGAIAAVLLQGTLHHSKAALAAEPEGQADAISLEVVSAFHIRLNEVCRSHRVGMGYCGPLARSGRALAMVEGRKDIYRWTIHEGWDRNEVPTEVFQLRLARHKPRDYEFGAFKEGTVTYYIVLESDSDPNAPLKQLRGKTPREFLRAVVEKAASNIDE